MSFSRTHDHAALPNNRGDSTRPRFHMAPVQDEAATASAGMPIFRDEERVQHLMPGSFNSHVERVTDEHRQRWPREYAGFKSGTQISTDGTPLEQWPLMTVGMIAQLKVLNVFTVQQCAALNDEVLSRIPGTGMRKIKEAAAAYLDDAEATKQNSELRRANELLELRNAEVESKLAVQADAIEKMQAELLRIGNRLSNEQTYVPAHHDPVEQARQFAPPQVAQAPPPSAIDAFQLPARRPGRPTNAEREARQGAGA